MKEQERSYNPSELEVGMVFDNSELIIFNGAGEMQTIVNESGIGDHARPYDVMIFNYDLIPNSEGLVPTINGRGEVHMDDSIYSEYSQKLKRANLWSEH